MSQASPFERATPESQGVAAAAVLAFVDGVESQHLGLHSFMLLRHGRVVAEAWWRPFTPVEPHILYSLTKSFTSTAAGLAIAEGKLSLDDPVLSFFPREASVAPSHHWRAMRVRHLLMMATGHEVEPGAAIAAYPPQEWLRYILQTPLPHPPGTHFLYNSTGSHIISVIVQKVTGQKLVNYLRDRLFRPLGIGRPHWEADPLDRNWGGFGLYLRTDEIARFGQMLLDHGRWQGQQVVPAAWVDLATAKQIDNGDDPNSDWAQGYGFQYWMSRHGFRGDGAFGQFCVVLREQDAVLAITASTPNMQGILDVAWQTLLPGLYAEPLQENPTSLAALQDRLAGLEVEGPHGAPTSPLEVEIVGRRFELDANPLGWQALRLQRDGSMLVLNLAIDARAEQLVFGTTDWHTRKLRLDAPRLLPAAGSARWVDEKALDAVLVYLNPASTRSLKLRFDGDAVQVRTTLTGTFAPPDELTLTGRAT